MQMLIYKTELVVERAPRWLAPNSVVELGVQADGTVAAFAQRPSTLLSMFGGGSFVRIGVLEEGAGVILRSALEVRSALRVRIVELHPPHLTADRRTRISVSVWGGAAKLAGSGPYANAGLT